MESPKIVSPPEIVNPQMNPDCQRISYTLQTNIEKENAYTVIFEKKRIEPTTFTHDLTSFKKIKSPKISSPPEMVSPQMNRGCQKISHTNSNRKRKRLHCDIRKKINRTDHVYTRSGFLSFKKNQIAKKCFPPEMMNPQMNRDSQRISHTN